MPPDPRDPLEAQRALAAWIRDPLSAPAPVGVEPRRLQVYADLVFNNITSLLATTFPVLRAMQGDDAWQALMRDFLREHPARTPVFSELARELLRYLDTRWESGRDDPPWLRELAHYEWVELALQLSEARPSDVPHAPDGDLRAGVPVLSPVAWPLAYDWPVHRIAPGHRPEAATTLLLLHREAAGNVAFHELGPVAFHLLHRLTENPAASGDAVLRALARDAQAPDADAFVEQGLGLLERYRRGGIVLGTRPPD
ncbi:DNA-binding domain-containing protein [Cognatilysobacter segetis]|uniref:HvfC family RiPP maturation protein n=1 Tax=Cognatilysobacter segetis TaxID=2492394 RepID=UPI00105E552D|nr:putative DNA-binding domain-containing protein [Lysobacter segetis]